MQYRRLGRSNLKVSTLCLGTMMFADQTDLAEARNMVASAHEHGINFIDTADVYSKGGSEEMLGQLLTANRNDWILATKLGNSMSKLPNQSHYSRHWIIRERSEEHTSELQSLMRISYSVFCLKKKK